MNELTGGKTSLVSIDVKPWVVDMIFMHILFVVMLCIVYFFIVPIIIPG